MMNSLREQASGWVVRLLLGMLVLSFAAWGIGDIFRSGGRDVTLAEVGGTHITRGAYEMEYQRKVAELRSMLGASYSPGLLKNLNIEMQVLAGLVDREVVRKEANSLGIMIGDSEVQDLIRKNPDFQGEAGKFDLRTFQRILESNQLNEKRYYDSVREQISAELILSPLTTQDVFPSSLVEKLVAYQLEGRTADVLVIPPNSKLSLPAPSEDEIKKHYEATKNNYTAPEMRAAKYIDIRYEDAMKSVSVPAEDINKAYKDRLEEFKRPETRELSQLLYDNQESAQKAYDMLQAKSSFADVAKKVVPTNADKINLGFVKKSDVPANAAGSVFGLKAGEYTKPVSSDFGWHIFLVKSIKPESIAELSEVQPQIEKDLKQRVVEDSIYSTVNKLEDALAAGTAFDTAAKDLGLAVKTTPIVTKTGMDEAGKKAEGLPPYSNFLSTLFNTDDKNQSPTTIADDGSYFVIETTKVIPERIKSLDEVKSEVISELKEQKAQALLENKANQLANDLKSSSVADAVQKSGLSVKRIASGTITRSSKDAADAAKTALSAPLVSEIFNTPVGKSTAASPQTDSGYAIAIVKSITPATAEQIKNASGEHNSVEEEIKRAYKDELYEQYMRYLRSKHNVALYQDRLPKGESEAGNER